MKNTWVWLVIVALITGLLFFILRNRPSSTSTDQLNAEGIRSDVEKAIAEKFPESEKKRAAVTQMARAFQKAIDYPDNALEIDRIWTKSQECLDAIEGLTPADGPTGTSGVIESFVVNSFARSRAYTHYNAGLSGQVSPGIEANINSCEFDPNKMRN
jgi:hypothetical protein